MLQRGVGGRGARRWGRSGSEASSAREAAAGDAMWAGGGTAEGQPWTRAFRHDEGRAGAGANARRGSRGSPEQIPLCRNSTRKGEETAAAANSAVARRRCLFSPPRCNTHQPRKRSGVETPGGCSISLCCYEQCWNYLVVVDKQISRRHLNLHASFDGSIEVVVEGPNPIVVQSAGRRRKVCSQERAKIAHDDVLELIPGDYLMKYMDIGDEHKSPISVEPSDSKKGKRHSEEDTVAVKRNRQIIEDEALARKLQNSKPCIIWRPHNVRNGPSMGWRALSSQDMIIRNQIRMCKTNAILEPPTGLRGRIQMCLPQDIQPTISLICKWKVCAGQLNSAVTISLLLNSRCRPSRRCPPWLPLLMPQVHPPLPPPEHLAFHAALPQKLTSGFFLFRLHSPPYEGRHMSEDFPLLTDKLWLAGNHKGKIVSAVQAYVISTDGHQGQPEASMLVSELETATRKGEAAAAATNSAGARRRCLFSPPRCNTHPPRKRSGVETPGWLLDFPFADFSKESGYLRNPLSSAGSARGGWNLALISAVSGGGAFICSILASAPGCLAFAIG
ncbi:hypothetical protein ACP4OV_029453 [Aristida adscensionis]